MLSDGQILNTPRTAREQLLEVAGREGWTVLHDLGLHLELQRGLERLNIQFDVDGRCTWCEEGDDLLLPLEAAFRALVRFRSRRLRQGGHL